MDGVLENEGRVNGGVKNGSLEGQEGLTAEDKGVTGTTSKMEAVKQAAVKQTVIRLKRRIEDSPSKILVVSYKRLKTEFGGISVESSEIPGTSASADSVDKEEDDMCKKILRLVGTVPEEEADNNNITLAVRNIIGANGGDDSSRTPEGNFTSRRSVKAKRTKITEKARERFKKSSEESRFKIIASRRGVSDEQENLEGCDKELLKLLDLVPESDVKEPRKKIKPEGFEDGNVTCNGRPMVKEVSEDEKGYVYDLYLANDPCMEEFMCGQFLSVEEGDEELDFGEYRETDEEDFVEDDDDSNAEDNYRNDYPDSEEEGLRDDVMWSYGAGGATSDDDMLNNFKSMKVKGDSSSEDELVYGIDDDNDGMGFDHTYSKYKRRVMQEYEDEVVSVSSESDYD